MKRTLGYLSAIALFLALICAFLPAAQFRVAPEAILEVEEDIVKLEEKVVKQQDKYNELVAENAAQDKLDKQKDKVDKAIAKVEEAKLELEDVKAAASGSAMSSRLFLFDIPQGIEIDKMVINESGVYQPFLEQYAALTSMLVAMIAIAFVLTVFSAGRQISKAMTLASVLELCAMLLSLFIIQRIRALPIKAPYGAAALQWPVWVLIAATFVAWLLNIKMYLNTARMMIYFLCVSLCILSLFPFWIMFVNATRSTTQIQQGVSIIPGNSLGNNWAILMGKGKNFDVLLGLRNSAIIAFGSTFLSVYFSSLCAYGLTAYEFKGRKAMFSFIVGVIMIPTQVSSIGFYMYMYRIGWTDSYLPLILPAIAAPSTVFFMKQYLQANFQIALVEAARIDGSGEFRTYNTIITPIMIPAMATMAIISVIGAWNDYLKPLMLLQDPMMSTLPMMVRTLRGDIYRTEYGSIYLGLALTALPLLIVYFCLSQYIIQGVAVGGVKE